jgi:hypothetical protein
MTDEPDTHLQTLWRQQPTEVKAMSAAEIHTLANRFQSKIQRRNLREYALAAAGVAFFVFAIVKSPDPWMKAACLLIIAGLAVYALLLYRRGRADREGLPGVGEDCRRFHIDALTRQRDLIGSVWLWGIAPVLPGLALFMGRRLVLAPAKALPLMLAADAGVVLLIVLNVALNLRGAQRLQKQIDALKL